MIIRNGANSILFVEEFFKTRVNNPVLEYKIKICGIEDICNLETYPSKNADVYVSERLVSSTLSNFSPKKVRVFIWRR